MAPNASPYASRQMGHRGFEHKPDEEKCVRALGRDLFDQNSLHCTLLVASSCRFFWRGNVVCPIKEHKHPSHSKDPRADIVTHFQPFLPYCFILTLSQQRKPESVWLQKRLIKRAGSLHARPGRSAHSHLDSSYCFQWFASSTEKGSVRSRGQPEVPRSLKTVLSVHWQRYWIFEEYLYPIKLLRLYMEQYELMSPFVSHFILSALLCFYRV